MGTVKEFNPNMEYHIFKDYNIIFDEHGSTYGTIRKGQWIKDKSEIDEAKAKLEIRKLYTNSTGERIGKGYTFNSEEGAHELTEAMISIGYGNTKNILKSLRKREDFVDSVKNIDNDNIDDKDGEMFDMRELLLGESIDG